LLSTAYLTPDPARPREIRKNRSYFMLVPYCTKNDDSLSLTNLEEEENRLEEEITKERSIENESLKSTQADTQIKLEKSLQFTITQLKKSNNPFIIELKRLLDNGKIKKWEQIDLLNTACLYLGCHDLIIENGTASQNPWSFINKHQSLSIPYKLCVASGILAIAWPY